MKKVLSNTLIIFISLLVFYGGAGVYSVSFCCDECKEQGLEVLVDNKCCEIHHHTHERADGKLSCSTQTNSLCSHKGECSLERFSVEWSHNAETVFNFQPIEFDLLADLCTQLLLVPLTISEEVHTNLKMRPPLYAPRTYLSILTTLLI